MVYLGNWASDVVVKGGTKGCIVDGSNGGEDCCVVGALSTDSVWLGFLSCFSSVMGTKADRLRLKITLRDHLLNRS